MRTPYLLSISTAVTLAVPTLVLGCAVESLSWSAGHSLANFGDLAVQTSPQVVAIPQAGSGDLRLSMVMGEDGVLGDCIAVAITNITDATVLLPDLDAIHVALSIETWSPEGDVAVIPRMSACGAARRAGLKAIPIPAKLALIVELGPLSKKWLDSRQGYELVPRLAMTAGTPMEYRMPQELSGSAALEMVPHGKLDCDLLVIGVASAGIAVLHTESIGDDEFRKLWLDSGASERVRIALEVSESARRPKALDYWIKKRRLPSRTTREDLVSLPGLVNEVEAILGGLNHHAIGSYSGRELLRIATHSALDGASELRLRLLERMRRQSPEENLALRIDALLGWASVGQLDFACQLTRY